METIFMNSENSKTNESNKFVLNSQRLDLRNSYKHAALQNVYIFYTWKNIGKQYKKNQLKKQLQHGMMNLNCQMVLMLSQIFKIISNISLKSAKH